MRHCRLNDTALGWRIAARRRTANRFMHRARTELQFGSARRGIEAQAALAVAEEAGKRARAEAFEDAADIATDAAERHLKASKKQPPKSAGAYRAFDQSLALADAADEIRERAALDAATEGGASRDREINGVRLATQTDDVGGPFSAGEIRDLRSAERAGLVKETDWGDHMGFRPTKAGRAALAEEKED